MAYRWWFQHYRYSLEPPLLTAHGSWPTREGIILQIAGDRTTGWGEIAPIPWFGSETLDQAWQFCASLPSGLTADAIANIPESLPACQFGFAWAWQQLHEDSPNQSIKLNYTALLPAGIDALSAWPGLYEQGYKTFKWKIAVYSPPIELEVLQALRAALPGDAKLRLDANGGLSSAAEVYLRECEGLDIEFLEQPLPPAELDKTLDLSNRFCTPLALDEAIASPRQLQHCYQRGWRGVFVVKPAIFGYPQILRDFCDRYPIDLVISSALETSIGRRHVLQMAQELQNCDRAVGFSQDSGFTPPFKSKTT